LGRVEDWAGFADRMNRNRRISQSGHHDLSAPPVRVILDVPAGQDLTVSPMGVLTQGIGLSITTSTQPNGPKEFSPGPRLSVTMSTGPTGREIPAQG
jgi:hypothetical protein